jgi:hypothetical protein
MSSSAETRSFGSNGACRGARHGRGRNARRARGDASKRLTDAGELCRKKSAGVIRRRSIDLHRAVLAALLCLRLSCRSVAQRLSGKVGSTGRPNVDSIRAASTMYQAVSASTIPIQPPSLIVLLVILAAGAPTKLA